MVAVGSVTNFNHYEIHLSANLLFVLADCLSGVEPTPQTHPLSAGVTELILNNGRNSILDAGQSIRHRATRPNDV